MDYFDNGFGFSNGLPIDTGYRTYAPATKGDLKRVQGYVIDNFNKLVDGFNENVDYINDNIQVVNSLTATGSAVISSAANVLATINSDYQAPSSIASTASSALANAIYAYSNATSAASTASQASNTINQYNQVLSGYGSVIKSNTDNANDASVNASNASINASNAIQQVSNNTTKVNGLYAAYNQASNAVNKFNNGQTQSVINSLYDASDFYQSLADSASTSYTNAVYQSVLAFNQNTAQSAAMITEGAAEASANLTSLNSAISNASSLATTVNTSAFSSAMNAASYIANGSLSSSMNSMSTALSVFYYTQGLWYNSRDSYSIYLNSLQTKINNTSLEFSWSASANQSYTANFSSYAEQLSQDATTISGFASAATDAYNNTQNATSIASTASSAAAAALALAQSAQSNAGAGNSTAFLAKQVADKASSDASNASSAEIVDRQSIASNSASIAYNDFNRQEFKGFWQQSAGSTFNIKLPDCQSTLQLQRQSSGRYYFIANPQNGEKLEANGLASYSGTSGDNLTTTTSLVTSATNLSTGFGYSSTSVIDMYLIVHQANRDRFFKINGVVPMNPNYSTLSNTNNAYSSFFAVTRLN